MINNLINKLAKYKIERENLPKSMANLIVRLTHNKPIKEMKRAYLKL